MPLPGDDQLFNTRNQMLHEIMVSLGGRIAEELVFDDVTTGASQDIKQATKLARDMVRVYGFSKKLGMVNYDSDGDDVLISRDFGHTKSYGEQTAALIDAEVKGIIDDCYQKARQIIESHRDVLEKCSALLLEREKIGFDEFEALF